MKSDVDWSDTNIPQNNWQVWCLASETSKLESTIFRAVGQQEVKHWTEPLFVQG